MSSVPAEPATPDAARAGRRALATFVVVRRGPWIVGPVVAGFLIASCRGTDEQDAGYVAARLACLDFVEVFVRTAGDSIETAEGVKKLSQAAHAAERAAQEHERYRALADDFDALVAAIGDSDELREPLERVMTRCDAILEIGVEENDAAPKGTVLAPNASSSPTSTVASSTAPSVPGEAMAREACDRYDRFNLDLANRRRRGQAEEEALQAVMPPIVDAAARAAKADPRWEQLHAALSDYVEYVLNEEPAESGSLEKEHENERIDELFRVVRHECEKARA